MPPVSSSARLTVSPATGDPNTLHAAGEIDSHTSAVLEQALATVSDDAVLTLDMAEVTFTDSSGLTVLVGAHKRLQAGGGSLVIKAPSPAVS